MQEDPVTAPVPNDAGSGAAAPADSPKKSEEDPKKKSQADWYARGASLLSILLTLGNIYLTLLRPADLAADIGNRIFLQGHARLLLVCLFTNTGAKQAVVKSAGVVCDGDRHFDWNMVASHIPEWEYTEKGPIFSSFKYSIGFPFAVKKDDQYMSVLVFTGAGPPANAVAFGAGPHLCQVQFEAQGQKLGKSVDFRLTSEDVESLTKNPSSELPIVANSH
jgi:hypothetical protein